MRRQFILAMQIDLLQRALLAWPRRAAPLLEVNCGAGEFLPFLWQWGFDIWATEADSALRGAARQNCPQAMDVRGAEDTSLPFDDEFFDWTIVHLQSVKTEELRNCASEALRVSKRGLMLTFWNSMSPALLLWKGIHRKKWFCPTVSSQEIWHLASSLHAGRLSGMSTLCGPVCTWRTGSFMSGLNGLLRGGCWGAWAVIRIDFGDMRPVTPLALRLDKGVGRSQPVMEYGSETITKNEKKNL